MAETISIEKQKEHIEKIKNVASKFPFFNGSLTSDEIDTIQRALACHMAVITSDVSRREKAMECGSPDGNLQCHDEATIVKKCIGLMNWMVHRFQEWYECVHGEDAVQELDDEEIFTIREYIVEIVRDLLLSHTSHSGGTSSRAKCRELGFDPHEEIEFGFEKRDEE